MSVFSGPTARFNNRIKVDAVCLVKKDESGFTLSEKRIESGGSADVGYRKGIDRMGPPIYLLVVPENRPDVLPGRKILPIELFEYSDIDIGYKLPDGSVIYTYQAGAAIHFEFRTSTTFRRIGLVRCVTGLCDSVITAFGNCCSAALVPNPEEAAGHAPAPVQAPLAVVVAPASALDPIQDPLALGDAPAPAPSPIPSTSLILGETPVPASATEPSISLNMVEALGQASLTLGEAPGLALYPTEAITPAPALHVGIDFPSAAQVAAPATPSEIVVLN